MEGTLGSVEQREGHGQHEEGCQIVFGLKIGKANFLQVARQMLPPKPKHAEACQKPHGIHDPCHVLTGAGIGSTFDDEMCREMRRLAESATLLIPNVTEASFLLGKEPKEHLRKECLLL